VSVRNVGDTAVLVLFGEEIRGAKQNRIANASFLVPAQQQIDIDVSCVEQGRWRGRPEAATGRARFGSTHGVVSRSLRQSLARDVGAARAAGESFRSDQGRVWDMVGERIAYARTESPTHAYADYAETRSTDLAEMRRAFRPLDDQVGFVAQIGEAVVGVEAIGSPGVFASVFERLIDGYAIDSIDAAAASVREEAPSGRFNEPEALLEALRLSPVRTSPSLGLGRDLRIHGRDVEGCALEADGLVHLSAYPAPDASSAGRERSPERSTRPGRILRRLRRTGS
jgi:hypothetical protein